jgi:L-alanine-DL-glutamate epimerase and related enzymes of enolase superfamily
VLVALEQTGYVTRAAHALEAPSSASECEGAPDGVYLDSRKYMQETLKLFGGTRSKIGLDVALCHDVRERLKPVEAVRFACEFEQYDLFVLEDAIRT